MSEAYYSGLIRKVVLKLSIDEAEDIKTDLIVMLEEGCSSKLVESIAHGLMRAIKEGKKWESENGLKPGWIKSDTMKSIGWEESKRYESRWFCSDCGWWSNEEPMMNGMNYCPGCGVRLICPVVGEAPKKWWEE